MFQCGKKGEYDRRFARQVADQEAERAGRLDNMAEQWEERRAWWNKAWPKQAPAQDRSEQKAMAMAHSRRLQQ